MNLARMLFVRSHYVLAKMLRSIGNPNPYYAATLLIAIFIALDTMAVYVVVATIIGSSGEVLGANTYYVISAVYFAFYLYLVRYIFGNNAYSLNIMRGMFKADKVNRYKVYVSLWAIFSVISLPLLGVALAGI